MSIALAAVAVAGPATIAASAVFVAQALDARIRQPLTGRHHYRGPQPALPVAGELPPVAPDLDGWNLAAPALLPPAVTPDTGEFAALMGEGQWTGEQEAERLAAKYMTAEVSG
jgi:hypothetical protein